MASFESFFMRYRWFESISLQRRVRNELLPGEPSDYHVEEIKQIGTDRRGTWVKRD